MTDYTTNKNKHPHNPYNGPLWGCLFVAILQEQAQNLFIRLIHLAPIGHDVA